jgi:hypothetical protein
MTATRAPAASRPAARRPGLATGRLLRLELRHSPMLWMASLAAGLFWIITYRKTMAMPPLWTVRAMTMQATATAVFAAPVAGAAAWAASRDHRRDLTDLLAGTARPRWAAQLAGWAATTCWALAAYSGCVAVVYFLTARQASWGGPLWWPAAVGAASLPALAAIGFAAGTLFPSRFTTPLVAIVVFLALVLSTEPIRGSHSYWQVSPIVPNAWDVGPADGLGTFYHYLPDLPIVQVLFLGGLTVTVLGALGLAPAAGGRWLRAAAACSAAVGVVAASAAVALAGTGRLDDHGMIAIPAIHDAASDRPIRYTPACSHTVLPVCLNPAYAGYLPAVTAAIEPVLTEVAGLPGAPVRLSQAPVAYQQRTANGVAIRIGPSMTGRSAVFRLVLPDQFLGPSMTTSELAEAVRSQVSTAIVDAVVYGSASPDLRGAPPGPADAQARQARAAVALALLKVARVPLSRLGADGAPLPGAAVPPPARDAKVVAAASRLAALPAAARHAWLAGHLTALRAGRITLAQLP